MSDQFGYCAFSYIDQGNEWWVPAAITFHNTGLYSMVDENKDGVYSTNICDEDGEIGDCYPTRYVLATVVARLRGEIPLEDCGSDFIEPDITCL